MRRPSVLFINRIYPPYRGATGRILRDLAKSMAREGWQVSVLTTGAKEVRERDGGVRVIRIKGPQKPGSLFGYFVIWWKLLRAGFKMPPPHLVVTMTDPPLLVVAGQMLARRHKARHMHWCQDLYPDVLPALGIWLPEFLLALFKTLSRRAMKRADKVIVVGRCMARHLTDDGFDAKQITVIPNWPEFELATPPEREGVNEASPARQNPSRKKRRPQPVIQTSVNGHHKPHGEQLKDPPKFRVLYAGNLGRAHPVDPILDAAEALKDINPEIEFLFVGDGPEFIRIAEERGKRHLNNVRLLPYQPLGRLRTIMESGDIHLISIRQEAGGMVVPSKLYAALAVGRPCIFLGPAQSETAKVITDFQAGSVMAQGDTNLLVEEIRRYRYDGALWLAAQEGALEAGRIFVPKQSIDAWIERAWSVVEDQVKVAA